MTAWHWTGTAFEPCTAIPLTDRGFRYGMSVFASLRATTSGPEFFEQHITRLLSACAEREMALPEETLRAAAPLLHRAGFARIYVTAGDGSPAAAITAPRVFVFIDDRPDADPDDPWALTIHDDTYRPVFPGLKTANYWPNADALAHARRRGHDEALLFNDRAELVSGCCANVFLVRDGRLLTPARSSGCRTGVIREWVIARRKTEERRIKREDVLAADEIFLTNSWIGVQPAATLEGRPLGHRAVGPRLAAELARRTGPL